MGLEVIIYIFLGVLLLALFISEVRVAIGYENEPFCPICNKQLHPSEIEQHECSLCHEKITDDNVYYKMVKSHAKKGGK